MACQISRQGRVSEHAAGLLGGGGGKSEDARPFPVLDNLGTGLTWSLGNPWLCPA